MTARRFVSVLLAIWAACCIGAYFYSQHQNIPLHTAAAILPAFLLEAAFYIVLGSESVRTRLETRVPRPLFALLLAASALAPYCVYTLALHCFHPAAFWSLAALVAAACFWYVVLPHIAAIDVVFVALMAAAVLAKVFARIYPSPLPHLRLEILGTLMWIRVGAFALLSIRRVQGIGFGFFPTRKDWFTGILYYVLFLPVGAGLAFAIHFAQYHAPIMPWWKISLVAAGTFVGFLWVTALGEEFLFRGLLQQWFSTWLASDFAGLLCASVLFGLVHLFHNFPNWKFAVMAGAAGVFYGIAFRQAKSIRASMVTHALVVTTWRLFLSS
ncbi:MAG: CPBP family intramembrane glutamic endopeptidase [Bryobacteraceae bacterium]